MKILKSWVSGILSWLSSRLPDIDLSRLRTGTAWVTLVAVIIAAALFLVIRIYKLSVRIRKMKEDSWGHRPERKALRKLKRRSRLGTLLGLLLLAAVGFVLVYFVYPAVPGLAPSGSETYQDIVEQVGRAKLLNVLLGMGLLLLIPALYWTLSRRVYNKNFRTFVSVMAVICLISFIPVLVLNFNPKREQTRKNLEVSGKDLLARANSDYHAKQYESAKLIYSGLAKEKDEDLTVTKEDLLNNLALTQMQLGENKEALATMKRVFRGDPSAYHVINLLTAAHINGVSSHDILTETRASNLIGSGDLTSSGDPKSYTRLRNAIAYNIVYMDMEQDDRIIEEGTPLEDLFPDREALGDQVWAGRLTEKNAYASLWQALEIMQAENKQAYGGEDSDIRELEAYLEVRSAGGKPVVGGEGS